MEFLEYLGEKRLDDSIRRNLIRVLDKAVNAIKNEDIKSLKDVSNETIHDSTLYQEEHTITVAVLIYSLAKIYERDMHYAKFKGWNIFCVDCLKILEDAKKSLIILEHRKFDDLIQNFIKSLDKLDKKFKDYIQEVFSQAKINKASRLYEHGISLGRTAELLGITKFELMDYIGKTGISDVKENKTISPIKRLKLLRGLF
ncbi:hypothetical protein J4216_01300 [Candidatus Woesearchaeota archaeon]|nr:hypothetical protein [Candidatus Woesearchaeota archaeon]